MKSSDDEDLRSLILAEVSGASGDKSSSPLTGQEIEFFQRLTTASIFFLNERERASEGLAAFRKYLLIKF